MTTDLIIPVSFDLLPPGADDDTRYRLGKFTRWMAATGRPLTAPDLAAYRDYLAPELAPATIRAHLSTIRGAYRRMIENNDTRGALYAMAPAGDPADRKAFVDEAITRVQNAIAPAAAPVVVVTRQDRPDNDQLRLTREQAEALLNAPGIDTMAGLRDTAIIALILCTGIREAELCGLDVPDLRQGLGGELALHVRHGKGAKERLIPYGELSWCLVLVSAWLQRAGIVDGAVFRGLYKGGAQLRPGRLSVRAVEYIVSAYPIAIDGHLRQVKAHDLRRTYARRLYEGGADLLAIQQNLGHAHQRTTSGYIGELSAARRRAPAVYSFDLSKLQPAK